MKALSPMLRRVTEPSLMRQPPTQGKGLNDGVIDASGSCFDVFGAECVNNAAFIASSGASGWRIWTRLSIPRHPLFPSHDGLRYSIRSAFMGEIDAARAAGMIVATKAHVASAPAATLSASGSQNDTP